jgi:hypothetical protein
MRIGEKRDKASRAQGIEKTVRREKEDSSGPGTAMDHEGMPKHV